MVAVGAGTLAPPGPSLGRALRDPSRSILIDKDGNYISLAFSANPHGPAGDMKRETKRMRKKKKNNVRKRREQRCINLN